MSRNFYVVISEISALVKNYGQWQLSMMGKSGVYNITEEQALSIHKAISLGGEYVHITDEEETIESLAAQNSQESEESRDETHMDM